MSPMLKRVGRFGIVGVAVSAVYVGLYTGFTALGLAQALANVLAFSAAVGLQYVGQTVFTFERSIADKAQLLRFVVMIALGFVTSAFITGVLAPAFVMPSWCAAGLVVVILPVQNFIIMSLWVFSAQTPNAENQP